MARFLKYAFNDEATFTALPVPQGFAVPLGIIEGAYCVDILWDGEPQSEYLPYECWPPPIGVHTFLGWDETYTNEYNERLPK